MRSIFHSISPTPFLLASLILIALCLSACSATEKTPSETKISPYLSMTQAMERSARVSDVRYQLAVQLDGSEFFNVDSQIRFQLSDTSKALRLDINQAEIRNLKINGHFFYPNYNGAYLNLNQKLLKSGENLIELNLRRRHSTNGEGLHRFVDPIDDEVYLYSHFEPAAAQQMFALFDQPDLKAKFTLKVTTPEHWQVISTMREDSVVTGDKLTRWTFPPTPALSPYNFSLHAGPYHHWEDNSGRYPMRLFARQSVAEQVTAKDWFRYTQQGLEFFDDFFGIAYPFKKYDQVLVPDFLYGAMENAAAVTFSEDRFLFKAQMTQPQKQQLASVIMHEMAHQWFGDLVTMKWWNGLWLNESFASFMGTLATSEATEFSHAWRSFYAKGKQNAYQLDSLVTTHPIEVPVASTLNAFDNIDAITYSKGAAVLNQLRHLLGNETFRSGVNHYLNKYRYGNAELSDFISSLEYAAKRDLSQWQQNWLYTAGVNTLKVDLNCKQGFIEDLKLIQLPASDSLVSLREQKVQLALYSKRYTGMERYHLQTVTYSGKITEFPELRGAKCPDLVYPNYQDWGYVKVQLNPKSFSAAQTDLSSIREPLLRSMLWQSLWDSVISGNLSLKQYLGAVFVNAPKEQDLTVLNQIVASLHQAKDNLDRLEFLYPDIIGQPQKELLSEQRKKSDYRRVALKALEQMSLRKSIEHADNPEFQKLWFNAHIKLSSSQTALNYLVKLISDNAQISGITLNQDLRWNIIIALNQHDHPKAKSLLKKEQRNDPSDSGKKAALAAKISRPEASIKRDSLNQLLKSTSATNGTIKPSELSFSMQRVIMDNLYPARQVLLSQATTELRLESLIALEKHKNPVFMRNYNQALLPLNCNTSTLQAYTRLLRDKHTIAQLSESTLRHIKEAQQKVQQCLRIHQSL